MPEDIAAIAALPFEKGLLELPDQLFMIRAEVSSAFDGRWRNALHCEQTFKPSFDRLVAAGFHVVMRLSGRFDMGLCLLTKFKSENLANLARAWTLLRPGGVLVCAGAKNTGAASVERLATAALGEFEGLSKHHGRVFWTRINARRPPPADWIELDGLRPNVDGPYLTRPGIFNAEKIDRGSEVLVESLPARMTGNVADLGAGWGYLSCQLLARFPDIASLDLYEAEALALEAAQENLTARAMGTRLSFLWQDVTSGLPKERHYDWVVMNPPYHEGRDTNIDLGRAFIAAAANCLRPGGALLMVANQHLPYEKTLSRVFRKLETITVRHGFKVVMAIR